ncbi:MAG: hypothetical protein WD490_03405, partial [Opitutales bacterium]
MPSFISASLPFRSVAVEGIVPNADACAMEGAADVALYRLGIVLCELSAVGQNPPLKNDSKPAT